MASWVEERDYDYMPSVDEAHRMVEWIACPVHGSLVGVAADGMILGRCDGCAGEAARAILKVALVNVRRAGDGRRAPMAVVDQQAGDTQPSLPSRLSSVSPVPGLEVLG